MPLHPLPLDDLTGWMLGATAPRVARRSVVVVDLDDDPGWDLPPLPAELPNVVVGTSRAVGDDDPGAHPGAVACDLLVAADDPDLAAVAATVAAHPLASVALVRLLRGGPRTTEAGLEAESLAYSALQAGSEFARWLRGRRRRPRRDEGDPVRLERPADAPGLLRVTLQRPHVRNALDAAMQVALCDALDLFAADPGLTALELRGDGPDFCSGGDLDEFGTFESPEAAHHLRLERSVGRRLAAHADAVTVHLHGACAGSGIELPAFAGHVVAGPDTRISLPEVELGLIPGAGGTVSLPRRIGRHRTALLALRGAAVDASTARRWGLVDEIAPASVAAAP